MKICIVILFIINILTFIELGVAERRISRLEDELYIRGWKYQ